MTFAGLPFATLATAFAAFAAAVVLLYILKLKRRPVAVPFSRIWERILRDKEATSLFSQLKRLLSLLLQLALLAAMLLALGDPRTAANLVEGRNVVVLVDASASMQAIDVAPSRLEAGKKRLIETVRRFCSKKQVSYFRADVEVPFDELILRVFRRGGFLR